MMATPACLDLIAAYCQEDLRHHQGPCTDGDRSTLSSSIFIFFSAFVGASTCNRHRLVSIMTSTRASALALAGQLAGQLMRAHHRR